MKYYAPNEQVLQEKPLVIEVSCRYCGQRFILEVGDNCNITVGENHEVIGYSHEPCAKEYAQVDDCSQGVL